LKLKEWDERYRACEQVFSEPAPLVVETVEHLAPGRAIDLACGAGRNALFLAAGGWQVTAVDGSPAAIEILKQRAAERDLRIDARVADLEKGEFNLAPEAYDLVCDAYYLQRDMIPRMKSATRGGGIVIAIVHIADPGAKAGTSSLALSGELRRFFDNWTILLYREGTAGESCHKHPVAEIVARKPNVTTPHAP
jgi:tellurite methyltransferase